MKVYLATSGEYSDFRVQQVFARREDAEAYDLSDDVQEFELCEGPVETRIEYRLYWDPRIGDREATAMAQANPFVATERVDFDGQPDRVEHQWNHHARHGSNLVIKGWDLDRIHKVYSEQRAQFIARQDMGVEGS
jgi:hypothetical protein